MERLREEFAELKAVGDRPAAEGDFVTVSAEGYRDGEVVANTQLDDYMFEVGGGYLLPDLEQGVVGMKIGEEATIPVAFPDDYHAEELQGARLDFKVTVKDVKKKSLPPLNDEFAKDVSEFETLLELRLDIRDKLQAAKDSAADRQFRAAAIDAVAADITVDLPDGAIDRQAQEMVDDFARSLDPCRAATSGATWQATGVGGGAMVADMKPPEAETALQDRPGPGRRGQGRGSRSQRRGDSTRVRRNWPRPGRSRPPSCVRAWSSLVESQRYGSRYYGSRRPTSSRRTPWLWPSAANPRTTKPKRVGGR